MHIFISGAGRAGRSFATALAERHEVTLAHHDELPDVVEADLVLACVPDAAIAAVVAGLRTSPECVVAHVSGSRGLEVLAPHRRVGALHPLAACRGVPGHGPGPRPACRFPGGPNPSAPPSRGARRVLACGPALVARVLTRINTTIKAWC